MIRNNEELILKENGNPIAEVIPIEQKLEDEFMAWETASDEDFLKMETEI